MQGVSSGRWREVEVGGSCMWFLTWTAKKINTLINQNLKLN